MIQMGLSLITAALENGCQAIGQLNSVLQYVQDDLCKHLFQVTNKLLTFDTRVSFNCVLYCSY